MNQSLREQGLPLKAAKHPTEGDVVLVPTAPDGEHGETLHATQLLTPSERDFPWAMKALLGGAMVTHPSWRCGYWVLGDNGGLVDELGATVEYPYANLLETDFLLYEPPGETVHNQLRLSKAECATLRAGLYNFNEQLSGLTRLQPQEPPVNEEERDFAWAMRTIKRGGKVRFQTWATGSYWVFEDDCVKLVQGGNKEPDETIAEDVALIGFELYDPDEKSAQYGDELKLARAECAALRNDLETCRQELANARLTRENQVLKNVYERRRQEALIAQ